MVFNAMAILFIGEVYRENHRPAASLTNFIRNGVSSNKGVFFYCIIEMYHIPANINLR
jgi:hypothetical protein